MVKVLFFLLSILSLNAIAKEYKTYSAIELNSVKKFINKMVNKHSFDKKQLTTLFSDIKLPIYPKPKKTKKEKIKQKYKKKKPMSWDKYRSLFLTEYRIKKGLEFWEKYQNELNKAEEIYGVPPEIIVAILGIETNYGKRKGKHQVLWTLTNRAFNGFRRAKFYKKELEYFLLLVQKNQQNPLEPTGSYAGAIGYPQFISSSIHHYAVDFDKDGKIDLINNPIDSIGSIANYFYKHRWQKGGEYVYKLNKKDHYYKLTNYATKRPRYSSSYFKKQGVEVGFGIPQHTPIALIALPQTTKDEFWLTFWNFYVLTRYNHNNKYAMAAVHLSQELKKQWGN
ncbi:Membrane-bound lytic murein transglycosylase B precursor [hydrothermal vent metagenome]|uniref:Membrane-bound lytic murein transglycosylase B n=1 Tax=hydrothermal vent metagenome TaxID=652676 RepID=A0A1W1CDH0_9ZZZZ